MDFIIKLPLLEEPLIGIFYDNIIVIIDRFIKYSYYLPYREAIDIEELSYIFYRYIIADYSLSREIISDKGPIFTAKF
jgi:hypothetical protein